MSQLETSLPSAVTLDAVSTAFALAAGAKFEIRRTSDKGPSYIVALSLRTSANPREPSMAHFDFLDGEGRAVHMNYHFEFGSEGRRGLLLDATARMLALSTRVVESFGGVISIDGDEVLLSAETRWPVDSGNTGYEALQAILQAIRPVTAEDFDAARLKLDK